MDEGAEAAGEECAVDREMAVMLGGAESREGEDQCVEGSTEAAAEDSENANEDELDERRTADETGPEGREGGGRCVEVAITPRMNTQYHVSRRQWLGRAGNGMQIFPVLPVLVAVLPRRCSRGASGARTCTGPGRRR